MRKESVGRRGLGRVCCIVIQVVVGVVLVECCVAGVVAYSVTVFVCVALVAVG